MLRGRVLSDRNPCPYSGCSECGFLPKHMRRPSLNLWPSGRASLPCISCRSLIPSSDCNAVAASCSARMAKSPDRRHAMYGMPSGPSAEKPDIRMALAMSFCCTCQSYWRVGNRGRLWLVLGMSVPALLWSSVVRCSSSSSSEVGGDVLRGVEVAVGVVDVRASGGCGRRVGGGIVLS